MPGADSQSLAAIFTPDKPRVQKPYANLVAPASGNYSSGKVPKGPNDGKRDQGRLALEGLIGAK